MSGHITPGEASQEGSRFLGQCLREQILDHGQLLQCACQLVETSWLGAEAWFLINNDVKIAATKGINLELSTYGSACGKGVLELLSVLGWSGCPCPCNVDLWYAKYVVFVAVLF